MHVSELLLNSKRPLFHIGNGVRHCITDFLALAERLQVPFVTARNGNDLVPSDHPLYIGRPGTFAQRGANFAVQTCDLYIAIGTRLTLAQTGYNSKDYARNAVIVQVDIDEAELDKGTLREPIKIRADSRNFLASLRDSTGGDYSDWVRRCRELQQRYPVVCPHYATEPNVNSYHFIDRLSEACEEGDIIVTDVGFAFQNTHQAWKVKAGQRILSNCGLAPMGWGLPAAIGAWAAAQRRIILITGEGGLMFNIQELATVMHHRMPVKVFILDNGGYLTIKQTQEYGLDGRLMGADHTSGLSFPAFFAVAMAHNFPFTRTRNPARLDADIAQTLERDGPVLHEIVMSDEQQQAPRALNRRNPDGTMNPTKLEDAFPFLDPEEIARELETDNP